MATIGDEAIFSIFRMSESFKQEPVSNVDGVDAC